MLRLLDLVIDEAGGVVAILDGEFLQAALSSLIADGAVERMIDQEELHHALAALLDQWGLRADSEALGDFDGAGDGGARAPVDQRTAIGSQLGLAIGSHLGSAHLDEAHAAVAGGTERGMVAVVGHVAAALHAGLDEAGALGELFPLAVDLDIDHRYGRSGVFGLRIGCGGWSAHRWI